METKISKIIKISEALAGIPAGAYHSSSRERDYNLCRVCANNLIMRELGVDYNTLSKYVTSRHRASFYVQYQKHDANIEGWNEYRYFYNALKEKFLNSSNELEYMDRDKYDTLLHMHGINPNPSIKNTNTKMTITVHIGQFEGKVYSTPKNVSKVLKMLLDAFSEYDYNMSITKSLRHERIYQNT